MSPYRTADQFIKARQTARRRLGLALFTAAVKLCPEIPVELERRYTNLALTAAAERFGTLVGSHRQRLAEAVRNN